LRKAEKEGGISQEDERRAQDRLQKITDQYIKKVDEVSKRKETEVLEV
jgi:ribosome recycling factor